MFKHGTISDCESTTVKHRPIPVYNVHILSLELLRKILLHMNVNRGMHMTVF